MSVQPMAVMLAILTGIPAAEAAACTRVQPDYPVRVLLETNVVEQLLRLDVDHSGTPGTVLACATAPGDYARRDVAKLVVPGDGTLRKELLFRADPPNATAYPSFHTGDFDGDGSDDVVITWNDFGGPTRLWIDVHLDLGTGFSPAIRSAVSSDYFYGAQAGDFDGDGRAELIVHLAATCPGYATRNDVLRFDRDFGWSLRTRLCGVSFSSPFAVGDVDGDGADDLLGVSGEGVAVRYGASDAPLEYEQWYALGRPLQLIALRDAASRPSPVVLVEPDAGGYRLSAFRFSDRSPRRLWERGLMPGLEPFSGTSSDWDGDGRADLAFSFDSSDGSGFELLLGRGDEPPVDGPVSRHTGSFADLRDVDGDGLDDAIVYTPARGFASLRRGVDGSIDEGVDNTPAGAALDLRFARQYPGDIDGDGMADLVTHSYFGYASRFRVRHGNGAGGFGEPSIVPHPDHYTELQLVDLDDDGALDVVTQLDWAPQALAIAWNAGNGTFPAWSMHGVEGRSARLALGDLDGDGHRDVVLGGQIQYGPPQIWEFTPLLALGRQLEHGTSFRTEAVVEAIGIVDFDADGRRDVVYGAGEWAESCALRWRRQEAPGMFGEEREVPGTRDPAWIVGFEAADLDGDGTEELVVDRLDSGDVHHYTVMRSEGGGGRVPISTVHGPRAYSRLSLLDLDRDGHLDLVARDDTLRWLRGDGTGGFGSDGPAWYPTTTEGSLADWRNRGVFEVVQPWRGPDQWYWALTPQRVAAATEDTAPPTIEVVIRARDDGRFMVGAAAFDDCRTAQVTRRRVDLLALAPDASVSFAINATTVAESVAVFEEPRSGARHVVVLARDRERAAGLWEGVRANGGALIEQNELLEIVADHEYGPDATPSAKGIRGYRLVQQLVFHGGKLARVEVHHPTLVPTATFDAVDEVGRRASQSASLL